MKPTQVIVSTCWVVAASQWSEVVRGFVFTTPLLVVGVRCRAAMLSVEAHHGAPPPVRLSALAEFED